MNIVGTVYIVRMSFEMASRIIEVLADREEALEHLADCVENDVSRFRQGGTFATSVQNDRDGTMFTITDSRGNMLGRWNMDEWPVMSSAPSDI